MKLSVQDLNSHYGPAHILFDIALEVGEGEVVALLGRNGAGKSTTFRSIVGLVAQRIGAHRVRGQGRLGPADPCDRARRARLCAGGAADLHRSDGRGESRGRPPAARPNAPHWTREKLFTLFPNLGEMRDRPGGRMSGGEQQMLTIARTLMGNPSLVLLDEPSEGLSPKIVEQMVEAILTMKKEGVSIVVSEQNLHFARLISDRAYIIERGRICFSAARWPNSMRARISATPIWRCSISKKEAGKRMTRNVALKRSVKPSRPSYVLEEQIGFILRQVWQRHATIFARDIGINLTPTQWAALAKLDRDRALFAKSARAADGHGCRDHQGRDRPAHGARTDRDLRRSRGRPAPPRQPYPRRPADGGKSRAERVGDYKGNAGTAGCKGARDADRTAEQVAVARAVILIRFFKQPNSLSWHDAPELFNNVLALKN